MKLLAETAGNGMFYERGGAGVLEAHRPGVVKKTALLSDRIADGSVIVLAKVNDDATDDEFRGFWDDSFKPTTKGEKVDADKARESAIENFKSKYEVKRAEKPAPEKKTA